MWDIIYLQNTWYFCLFVSVMYWRLLHNWNTFKKVYLQFLMYLQSFIKDKGLNFENGWKSIPSRAGIFEQILYIPYWVSIPTISDFWKNPFSGRCIFLCIFLATACSFLYNFWQFWNFRPNVPTLNCSKCHEIFTACKKENIVDIVRHWILWPTTWIFINPKLRKWPNVPLRNHCEGLLNGHILTK